MVKTATTTKMTAKLLQMILLCWLHSLLLSMKLDDSQWKVDTDYPKVVEGSIGMYHWEI